MTFKCPTCKRPTQPGSPDFPFCCERCRILDLGDWASEKYRIPGPPTEAPPSKDGANKEDEE
ncbi:MAG: DNA gyrase inhibitor YacG [Bryobacteraceae bacterium]